MAPERDTDHNHHTDLQERPSYLIRGLVVVMIAVVVGAPLVGMRSLLFSLGDGPSGGTHPVGEAMISASADGGAAGSGELVAVPSASPSRSHSPSPSASPSPSRSARASRSPSAHPASPSRSSAPHTAQPDFSADYTTTDGWSSGFNGEVRVTNDGDDAGNWTVVITLPSGATVTDVWGDADAEQNGRTVTFTPSGGALGPGSSTTFDFQVHGATRPSGCSVDGSACG
jgi:hypothetical protein